MRKSMKQLDKRYTSVCNNITDARDYTMQHLERNIAINIEDFCTRLEGINIEECEEYLSKIEETIHQCKVAIKNEKSRRTLMFEIQKKTDD